jgi:hypothetical protein
MAAALQGAIYTFPTRALPQLTQEEDPEMRLSTQAASWFGNSTYFYLSHDKLQD